MKEHKLYKTLYVDCKTDITPGGLLFEIDSISVCK